MRDEDDEAIVRNKSEARRDVVGRRQSFPMFVAEDFNRPNLILLLIFAGNIVVAALAWLLVGRLMR